MIKKLIFILLFPQLAFSQLTINHHSTGKSQFAIAEKKSAVRILYSAEDDMLIKKSANFLAEDIEKISGKKPVVNVALGSSSEPVIIVGTIGKSGLIDNLIKANKIKVEEIRGDWERFIIQTVDAPYPGIKKALVIAGSDRRGAAYGVFTLSKEMGVSPWYWWADVPVKKQAEIYIENTRYVSVSPSVKYRGIFLNDEAPALRNWAVEKFGGFNHLFYEKVCELLLRNKANYLWPAMWLPTIFAEDDVDNARTAHEFGIVVSTSHHEPMMRAHEEWARFGGGLWNYTSNKEKLKDFWQGGIARMGKYESVVTVGMRGDGDEAMAEESAVDLLKTIITDQRNIIADVTKKPAHETPQVWALYKEVQDYYDKGMRVNDDITVLFSDDNWGNIRFLPKKSDSHKGGYGMYYHLDYVGAPRSYKWQNVTQLERVWEQMKLTYESGVKELWIVNVGDIKPMELPLNFFLDYAWDTKSIEAADLNSYYIKWAKEQFGSAHAVQIAELMARYTKYNARRIPEMLSPVTYSLTHYREADRIVEAYGQLLKDSQQIRSQLSQEYQDAFYQLVFSPIEMCANLNELYVAAGKNRFYAGQGRASANLYADSVKYLFNRDDMLTKYYHEKFAGGKWNHMMSQTHIGYTNWNHPPANKMPSVSYIHNVDTALLGYAIEHGAQVNWNGFSVEGRGIFSQRFPVFDALNNQQYYLEIYNRGNAKLAFSVKAQADWIKVGTEQGMIDYDKKIYVSIDWKKAPKGIATGTILISGSGKQYLVEVPIKNNLPKAIGFIENDGTVAIEASSYTRKNEGKDFKWTLVPNLGRTGSAMIIEPLTDGVQAVLKTAPSLEYVFTLFNPGELNIDTYLSPTQNFRKSDGLKFAIAIDDEAPTIVNLNEGENVPDYKYAAWWQESVADHIRKKKSMHRVSKAGKHILKVWALDQGIVLQKFVINGGELRQTYLGPPESLQVQQPE